MTTARVAVAGIVCQGRHGANPGERLEAQEFVVDLDVLVDVDRDSLDETLDYRVMADAARDAVAGTSFELLEKLAEAVAKAVYQFSQVVEVTAVVHKPGAAEHMGVDDVSAEVAIGP
jgi:dihydroneopterin aldolase